MSNVKSPFQQFFDVDGSPLNSGYVYVGTSGQNPETNPITLYWDVAMTQPAVQPLRTLNGYIVRNGTPAQVFVDASDYSITARNQRQSIVFSELISNPLADFSLNFSTAIHAATSDATLLDADEFGRWESVSGLLRKCTWANIVSTLSALCSAGWNAATATTVTGSAVVTGAVQSDTNPKFRVHTSATQSITSGVFTKIAFNTIDFDVGNFFDETTNYRYQPTVAGYYRIYSSVSLTSSTSTLTYAYTIIKKNGSGYAYGTLWGYSGGSPPSTAFFRSNASDLVYLNGTTDYIEVGAYIVSTGTPEVTAQAVFGGDFVP
jgi:hypothetical protein